ncbi:MAG: hypothetical protein ACHQD9_00180 [Chitinophagales bacterium]
MKKKIAFAAMITCLLLMAASVAFSQDDSGALKQTTVSNGSQGMIDKVIANENHECITVRFSNLDQKEEYHILVFSTAGQLLNTFWVDGNEMTLFVGSIPPGTYELVLMKKKQVIDKKEILMK